MPDPVKARPGVPSPEGNPIAKQVYKSGTGTLPQRPISTAVGNQRLIPIAPWSDIRLRINISQAAILSIVFANSDGIEVGPRVASTGTLTFTANAANTETVVINGKTYTFQTVLTDSDGNVLIGATASDSLDNLIAAIVQGAGSGTLYAASTTPNTDVSALAGSGDTMDVTALYGGTGGDAITTTETLANGSWGGATLSGGVDGEIAVDGTAILANTELVVDILGAEHIGEPWLLLSVGSLDAVANVKVFDITGSSFSGGSSDITIAGVVPQMDDIFKQAVSLYGKNVVAGDIPLDVSAQGNLEVDLFSAGLAIGATSTGSDDRTSPIGLDIAGRTFLHSGSVWDRERNNEEVTLLASLARTADQNSPDFTNFNENSGAVLVVDVSDITATPVLTVKLQLKDFISGIYKDIWTATATLIAIGTAAYMFGLGGSGSAGDYTEGVNVLIPRTYRLRVEVADTDSATYSAAITLLS